MSARLQHLIVRMLHDPKLLAAVYADPELALRDEGLDPDERTMLLAVDRRAYAVDSERAERVLSALIEEYVVSALALFHDGYTLDHLRTFFASLLFHRAVNTDQSLASAFGEHLATLAASPRARALVTFERALAQQRRSPPRPTWRIGSAPRAAKVARSPEPARITRAPHVASVALARGTLAAWNAAKSALQPEPLVRLLDAPPPLTDVDNDSTEYVLLERAELGNIEVSDIDVALHRLLELATQPRTYDELFAQLEQAGVEEAQQDGIISDLMSEGLLRRADRK